MNTKLRTAISYANKIENLRYKAYLSGAASMLRRNDVVRHAYWVLGVEKIRATQEIDRIIDKIGRQ